MGTHNTDTSNQLHHKLGRRRNMTDRKRTIAKALAEDPELKQLWKLILSLTPEQLELARELVIETGAEADAGKEV